MSQPQKDFPVLGSFMSLAAAGRAWSLWAGLLGTHRKAMDSCQDPGPSKDPAVILTHLTVDRKQQH